MSERAPGTRKPYRISKPREKWSEAEHQRFVNAINQHGRNWKRIVQEVGTRTVAQVRSHAQKYFLKLEKAGATEEVPPARAKRPAAKPYPVKNNGNVGESSRSSQSSQLQERKKPRRTERTSTRPNRQDFTFLEESPPISTDAGTSDSMAVLLADAEGKDSNGESGSNGQSTSGRENSAVSTADVNYAHGLSIPSAPSATGRFFHNATTIDPQHCGEWSEPADASSGAVAGGPETPNYGELYDVVGKLYTNLNGSNQHMLQQLGASQREDLVHMMDHLTGEMRGSVSVSEAQPSLSQPMVPFPLELPGSELGPLSGDAAPLPLHQAVPSAFSGLDPVPDVPVTHANTQGTGLLPSCTQPSADELDSTDWRMSADLNSILAPEPDYAQLPQLIDTKMFDY